MSTTTHTNALKISRFIKAPREKVFAAWTNPDDILKWFGPEGCCVLEAKIDLRVGGEFYFRAQGSTLKETDLRGVYREVVRPSRLVFTWDWAHYLPDQKRGESLVTIDLIEREGGTEVRLTHEGFPNAEIYDDHSEGWNGSLDKLEKLL